MMAEIENAREPVLQYCVFCDNIAESEGRKPVFVGIFDNVTRPSIISQFFVCIRWINGLGEHSCFIRILDPALVEIFKSETVKLSFSHRALPANFNHAFINFEFKTPGVYWIEVYLNDKMHLAIPLPVHGVPG